MANDLAFLSSYLFSQNMRFGTWLAASVIALSGCASMSKQECLTANWLDQGFRDGRNGQPLSRIADHQKACAKVDVRPDHVLYAQGREQGIVLYCTPENALIVGRQGQPYRNACPAALEQQFLVSYEKGKQLYDAEQRIEALNQDTRQLELLLRDEDNNDIRRYLRHNIRELDWERQRARDEQYYLERRLGD
ncbi:DUF2799 domain-containing protein [Oceanisphaera sp. W20_SRM_FM3]|uniref:DUF2799 domain-containing protein n=1 Tax=Oceanisphaera sp. W20_SRM_FM3 TaxID=3240267 RepID=UPI003F96EAF8